jgi:hypothetical protein
MNIQWFLNKNKGRDFKINFSYKNRDYTISGVSEVKKLRNDTILYLTFGDVEDKFPCIMLDYNMSKSIFKLYKLRAKSWGAPSDEKRIICLNPPLPTAGALDILVMFSLAIAKIINPNAKVLLKDNARMEDNIILSWLKYFAKRETAYSKYGFIRRESSLQIPDTKSFDVFKYYMNYILPSNLNYKIKEVLTEDTLEKLETKYKEINTNLKKYKVKVRKYSKNYTLEKIIIDWMDTDYLDEILDIINLNIDIDLRGTWYLSWYYYNNNISDNEKVIIKRKI